MPELHFKGKEFVYNHHLTVPFRPLVVDRAKSCGDDPDNLIIHGDNLHALKSLLPRYAGKVDLVFIDPPYNTGNESWSYNDNVNSPMVKAWLDGNPVNKEDMLRHDKWLCLMWPRLKLLHELLSESGSIWITLDDNEVHHARAALDEIFGEQNFVATVCWQNKTSPANDAKYFSDDFDYVIVYAKNKEIWRPRGLERMESQEAYYTNPDNDARGPWNSVTYTCNKSRSERPNLYYAITSPTGEKIYPSESAVWRFAVEKHKEAQAAGLVYWGVDGEAKMPRLKRFLSDAGLVVPRTVWGYGDVGHTQGAMVALKRIIGNVPFQTPKPIQLLQRIIEVAASDKESLILDSFAGSGTTAHAVLAQNAKDGGNRKFILVECEDYADTLTAERVRRVIAGYPFTGTQREELLREKITFSRLKQAGKLLDQVALVEQQNQERFDNIKSTVKNGELIVTGEKTVEESTEGLGGGFTYCTLGDKLELDDLLTGKSLPPFEAFGGYLFHTATGQPLDPAEVRETDGYLGESARYHVWLIYRPDLDFLKSREAALTLGVAEKIAATDHDKPHLVFAPARFVPQKRLLELGVEHAPLPYALYRIERD